jgi:hypothetical protein
MNTTFQNSAQVLSIGIFFTLLIVGLSSSLPASLYNGLVAHGVSSAAATRVSHLPPISTLFAAFLGYNPLQHLLGPGVLAHLSATQHTVLTGRSFFPGLIAGSFRAGLHAALDFAIVASLLAAAASWTRGAVPSRVEGVSPAASSPPRSLIGPSRNGASPPALEVLPSVRAHRRPHGEASRVSETPERG